MQYFPPALENLVEQFARLPGVGVKSAQRLAFHVLSLPEEDAAAFAQAILSAKSAIHCCPVCQNLTEGDGPCSICASPKRDASVICVVADPKDVVAMERARDAGLHNVFFVDGDAACLPDFFAPGEVDRIYINFCDPWPKSNQKKRRLTHGNFLQLYRRVLPMGGEIHFKSDNDKLFEWSLEEIPQFGFRLSQVTRDLHANGPVGVMTDYEAKFYQQGVTINRCVAIMVPWEAPAQPEEPEEA